MTNKRGNGEGTISKRPDGTWWGRITLGTDPEGRQKRKAFYGKTRAEVQKKLTEVINSINNNTYIDPKNITLSKWLDIWFNEYAINSIKQSTRVSYETYIYKHITPILGKIKLLDLRADTLQQFYNDKLENGKLNGVGGLSPKTIKNINVMLHKAIDQALKNGLVNRNVTEVVTLPKLEKKEMRVLTSDEQQQLLRVCNNENNGIFIVVALSTGMRLGEILGLKWSDIDFKNKLLTVRRTINRLKNYDKDISKKTVLVVNTPKTENSKRIIPLSNNLIKCLRDFKTFQKQKYLRIGVVIDDDSFIFPNSFGQSAGEPKTYQETFTKLTKLANLNNVHFHCLRHTFATRALEEGIPAKTVSEILGHSNISTTLDLYSHVLLETKREAIEKLSKFTEI